MRLHALVVLLPLMLCACGVSLPGAIDGKDTQPAPPPAFQTLARAHAHNDYEHERPLLDALDQGFTSVEADVFNLPLPGNDLYVAHSAAEIRLPRTLKALYLEPLRQRIAAHHGCVYDDCAPFTLLIDAKTAAEGTYTAVEQALAEYDDIFSKYENGAIRTGAITAILSGNRPHDTMAAAASRYCFYDGRLADINGGDPLTLMPLVSDDWTTVFTWDGNGEMPADEKAKLLDIVSRAHAHGQRVRLYGTPDAAGPARDNLWHALLDADEDLINTDDLAGLRAFLLAYDPLINH